MLFVVRFVCALSVAVGWRRLWCVVSCCLLSVGCCWLLDVGCCSFSCCVLLVECFLMCVYSSLFVD